MTSVSASYIYFTSSTVVIGDNIITLNAYSPYKRYAGMEMYDSGSSAKSSILWDSLGNYFFISGSTATNSQNKLILGPDNVSNLTVNYIPKAVAGNQINNSSISDNGTVVTIGQNTLISGYVTASNAQLTSLSTNATGYYLTVDDSTGNIYKSTATPAGSSGTTRRR